MPASLRRSAGGWRWRAALGGSLAPRELPRPRPRPRRGRPRDRRSTRASRPSRPAHARLAALPERRLPRRRRAGYRDRHEHGYAVLAPVRRHGAGPVVGDRHHRRRGRRRHGRGRRELLRRHGEPLVRQRRPRPHGDRRRRGGADARPGELLRVRRVREPARAGPRRAPRRLRGGRRGRPADLPRPRRRRRDRHRGEARAALLRRDRAARAHALIGRTQGYHGTHGLGTSIGGHPGEPGRHGPAGPATPATFRGTRSRRSRRSSSASARSGSPRCSPSP